MGFTLSRKKALARASAPTLVIHGVVDLLVPAECGKDTASVIPCAELMIKEGMGYNLPHGEAWPQIVDAITVFTAKVAA